MNISPVFRTIRTIRTICFLSVLSVLSVVSVSSASSQTLVKETSWRKQLQTALNLWENGQNRESEFEFLKALKQVSSHSAKSLSHVLVLWHLSDFYRMQGEMDASRLFIEQALAIQKEHLDVNHPLFFGQFITLARTANASGRYKVAEQALQQALTIVRENFGDGTNHEVLILEILVETYQHQEMRAEAIVVLERVLDILSGRLATTDNLESIVLAKKQVALADLYLVTDQSDRAVPLYQAALTALESLTGSHRLLYSEVLMKRAALYHLSEEYQQERRLLHRSLEIAESLLGSDHSALIEILKPLSENFMVSGDYEGAGKKFRRIVTIAERRFGETAPEALRAQARQGEYFVERGERDLAFQFLRRAVKNRGDREIWKPLDRARIFLQLAQLYHARKNFVEAEPLYRDAVEIFVSLLGSAHQKTVQTRDGYYAMVLEFSKTTGWKENSFRDTRQQLQEVQMRLKNLGLYSGPVDGIAGREMLNAIYSYQDRMGLPRQRSFTFKEMGRFLLRLPPHAQ